MGGPPRSGGAPVHLHTWHIPKTTTGSASGQVLGLHEAEEAGDQIFSNIAAFMKSRLCIPYTNAASKKTVSVLRKIVTENRASLTMTLCVRF